jgi:hypothetical protein
MTTETTCWFIYRLDWVCYGEGGTNQHSILSTEQRLIWGRAKLTQVWVPVLIKGRGLSTLVD